MMNWCVIAFNTKIISIQEMVGKSMKTKMILPLFLAALALLSTPAFAQINLRIGSVSIAPGDIAAGGCVQIPVFMEDTEMSSRPIAGVTINLDLADPDGLIVGGVAADVIIANAFRNSAQLGITNPGTDLTNVATGTGVACSAIFNQATLGSGSAVDFVGGPGIPQVFTLPVGGQPQRKQANYAATSGVLVDAAQNTEVLIAVLEIPIVAAPGIGQVTITAVADPARNFVQLDDLVTDIPFTLGEPGAINIFEAIDCTASDVAVDDPLSDVNNGGVVGVAWADPQEGGVGGQLDFTFSNTTNVDRVVLSGGGLAAPIEIDNAGGAASVTQTVTTAANGSPDSAANAVYTVEYQVEFPSSSGSYASGAACTINTAWNPPTAEIIPNPIPVSGGDTAFQVVLTNATWPGGQYGVFSSDAADFTGDINVVSPPTSVAGNVFTFDAVYSITGIDAGDIGTYSMTVSGPNSQNATGTYGLALEPPTNTSDCASIPEAVIGSSLTVPVSGSNVTEWAVIYDGTTITASGNATEVVIPNIVGTANSIVIRANGFDNQTPPQPTFVDVNCDLDFQTPSCGAQAQDPAAGTPVDVGTVITLTLTTTNAVAASINGVDMTVVSSAGADTNWTASYTAVTNELISAVITGADGEEVTCTAQYDIQVNCINPTIVGVTGTLGGTGTVSVNGTPGCSYEVTVTAPSLTTPQVVSVLIPDCGDAECIGTATIQYPLDATISVANGNTIFTVPTLGEWGLIAFITLLMGSAVVMMRRRRTV